MGTQIEFPTCGSRGVGGQSLLVRPLYYPESILDFHLHAGVLRNSVWETIIEYCVENDKPGNYREVVKSLGPEDKKLLY